MADYQLRYLSAPVVETIDAEDVEAATDLARMRLLFHEPGFGIAIYHGDVEVSRLFQQPKRSRSGMASDAGTGG